MKKEVLPTNDWSNTFTHASRLVRVEDFLFLSGQMATSDEISLAPEAVPNPRIPFHQSATQLQSTYVFEALKSQLGSAGCDLTDIVALEQFFPRREFFHEYRDVRDQYLEVVPASTALACASLLLPAANVELDVLAMAPHAGVAREIVSTDRSPRPLGGYSQAVTVGDWVFCAGATASDYRTAAPFFGAVGTGVAEQARVDPNLWYGSPIEKQVEYIMTSKLKGVLEAAGSSLDNIVRAKVHLLHLAEDYFGFQKIWKRIFPDGAPATVVAPIDGLGSVGSRVEITLIALKDTSSVERERIDVPGVPKPLGHEPHGIRTDGVLWYSTLMAVDEDGLASGIKPRNELPLHDRQARAEMELIVERIEKIAEHVGGSLDGVAKLQEYYCDLGDALATEPVIRSAWPSEPPATTKVQVGGPMVVPDCGLTVEAVAAIG